jgi:hypothetical protein
MSLLPAEFAELETFAETWCLPTEPERLGRRFETPMSEIVAFYDAVTPRAESALVYLEQYSLRDLPEDATNLLHLLYSMIQISFPVEAWGQQRVPDSGSAAFDLFVEPVP